MCVFAVRPVTLLPRSAHTTPAALVLAGSSRMYTEHGRLAIAREPICRAGATSDGARDGGVIDLNLAH